MDKSCSFPSVIFIHVEIIFLFYNNHYELSQAQKK